jgi:recombination protein RecT
MAKSKAQQVAEQRAAQLEQRVNPVEEKVELPAVQEPKQEIKQYSEEQIAIQNFQIQLEKYEKKILPELLSEFGISPTRFKQIVISELKRNDKLIKAFLVNPASMFASILAGAEVGLIPSELMGEYFLLPRNLKQPNGSYKLTVVGQIGYKGLVNIIMRSGKVTRLHTEVVYEGDEFEPIYGLEPNIIHKPDFTKPRTADRIKFVYAVAKNSLGEYQFQVLTRQQIIDINNMSPSPNPLYFNDKKNPNRWMERKVALVQLAKMLDKDSYSSNSIQRDTAIEGGGYLTMDDNDEIRVVTPQKSINNRSAGIYSTLNNIDDEQPD